MKFENFIKDKLLTTILIIFSLLTIEIFLLAYPVGTFIKIYIPIIILIMYFIGILIEYLIKNNYYTKLQNILNELDEKYLITEIIDNPNFVEGKILKETLSQTDKSMIENVNKYRYMQEDYKEYIELWIHEIKIPISASKMVIENNKSDVTKSIDEELDKVENYIEQALFYARSNTVEKDYYIKKVGLKEIVNESVKKNKNILIQEKVSINIHDVDIDIFTDSKWTIFILNQIIQNSIKYKGKKQLELELYARSNAENVVLCVKDNGIGIPKNEITRVFEKGFTGTNGRLSNKKSTGIGLYLCKKSCNKLRIGIEVKSVQEEGTEVELIFPQSSYIRLEG